MRYERYSLDMPVGISVGAIDCRRAVEVATMYFQQTLASQGHSNSYIELEGFTCDFADERSPIPDAPFYLCQSPIGSADPTGIITIGPP
ncbi:hypothetical protein GCM10007304_15880 [Rhodococcoides trifolii]|uniref:Uncharacterized protein n=1 Tax=Rhodococcoides trifolii TaxID=908250 RepID=A0A917D092_9NOCA|nr:hypothetical protein [Rhodococcus trifolii]GGG02658.1 hypothetical protein GCM10007304_15880 [Rhodococcus trifolii]